MEIQKENKMGVMPVNKLLLSMSLPIMISMLVQALYNIVDSIFVAKISENALTAVSLAFPIQSLMIATATGTGVGVNAILSKSLGEKNFEKANRTAVNGVFLAVMSYILFVIIGLTVTMPFYRSQTSDAEILAYGKQYLTIVCVASIGLFAQIIFERLLQSTGKTIYTMITQGTGAIINIILDPILIFGLLGFPAMGVTGAAVATVAGQIVGGIMGVVINEKVNHEIKLIWKGFRPSLQMIGAIYRVGVPSIIMQAIGSLMTYGMNLILISFTSTATAVFGVYFKLQSFIFMPIFGLNNGMIPIVAYNYGAGKKERLIKTVKLSVAYAMAVMVIGFLIFQTLPQVLLQWFNASDRMMEIGVPALRIISISFLLAGFCIICGSVFQALGNGVYSMVVSIARQLVVLLPVAFLLSKLGNVNYVWWAFPIAELMSLALSTFFLFRIYHKIIKHIGSQST
ncbi:MAG: MATE family efflux transporter [Lachnospiraceae bacterium]|jgi:putative MATE family efflux protein|nr:MATE family efflux transporter [Lachnospiraceae bacterium]MCI9107211.1 MATE family efflux transporter [Lachnospiraceae bacterium]MCI9341868.1 MATE family efflux transporter [Lachnospiraceae bacterium]GFH93051.1 multidrug export protein MepA [Lachnospiraceae bacterium]